MIKIWNETISSNMLGNCVKNCDEIINNFAIEYEKELKKLLPEAKIEINTSNCLNGHFIKVLDENEEELEEIDYYIYSEQAWDKAIEKMNKLCKIR